MYEECNNVEWNTVLPKVQKYTREGKDPDADLVFCRIECPGEEEESDFYENLNNELTNIFEVAPENTSSHRP